MIAEITYNAGATCQIKNTKFALNRTVLVSDSAVIKRAQNTKGFSVHVISTKKKTKKKTRSVERDSMGETRRATKKKTSKKTSSK